MESVAFIGTGVMGRSMAGHIMSAGHKLTVYNRSREKARSLLDDGAEWAEIGTAVAGADIVISMVGFPQDVEQIYFGDDGIIENARNGSLLVDMTTSRPDLAVRIAEAADARGAQALDAPVSGGDVGARNGTLSIMVGGPESAFNRMKPIFELMGSNIVLQGRAGAGQHTKMCNQIAIAPGMLGVCEALIYAEKSGLDRETVLQSIGSGAAGSWTLSNLAPRIIAGNFDPGFYVKHFIKDLTIAFDSAQQLGLELPGLKLAKEMYERLARQGGEDLGTHGLYRVYSSST